MDNEASILSFDNVAELVDSILPRLVLGDDEEGQTEPHVADITEEVVEVCKSAERKGALEVVVTDVLVPSLLALVLILEDQL